VKPARAVLLVAAVLFICNIWGYDLWAPDERFFGEGAREMVVDGQWLVTHVNGKVNTRKAPFFFWLIALLSLPFGRVTSLTARLPSALASLGTVAMTLRLGRRSSSERAAVLAVFILATTYMFWDKARSVQIDAVMCCLIWIALSAFEAWRAGDLGGRRAGLVFWAAGALAVLAKGPVGLLLPLGIALATLAVDREIGRWRDFAPFTGPLLFAAICGAWVAATMLWGPAEYSVWGALKEHFVCRVPLCSPAAAATAWTGSCW
jgi:4-amino-4-deoxy-L-arabinose transferase-like glycosyltransferase